MDSLRRCVNEVPVTVLNLLDLLLPLVRRGQQKTVVVLTSQLGSISDNFTGNQIALRAASAALNQIVRCYGIDAESWGGTVVLLSPQRSEEHTEESMQVTAAKAVRVITNLSVRDNASWLNTSSQKMNW